MYACSGGEAGAGKEATTATTGADGPRRPVSGCSAGELVVATYNLRRGKPTDGPNNWELRRQSVGELVRSFGADIIGFQEALAAQVDDLEATLPGYRREGVGRDDGARGGEFSPLFYRADRFEREGGGTFWLSPTPDRPRGPEEDKPWGTTLNRVASWVLLREARTGHRLLALSTHFDHASELARAESARLILRFVAEHEADHAVLLGDLNARPDSEPHRILAGGLADAAALAESVIDNPLHTTSTDWSALKSPGLHIDHVFVSRPARVLLYEAIDRRYRYSGADYYPSDHLPVRVRLCVDEPGQTSRIEPTAP
jgi:endonuclease/exonuclease/phosphatase family metal-dependent hydrolase